MNPPVKTKFIFKKKENKPAYNPPAVEYSFYQICTYPEDGFFHVRKLIYNQHFEVVEQFEKKYPKKKIEKFLKITPIHKYQLYPALNLKLIALPNPNQIISANSGLLC